MKQAEGTAEEQLKAENAMKWMQKMNKTYVFILQWADSGYWPNAPRYKSGYLHKFCVCRRFAGIGSGIHRHGWDLQDSKEKGEGLGGPSLPYAQTP